MISSTDEKLQVGWFTFSCCEDTTMMMIEALNEHWQEWTKKIAFVEAKVFRQARDDSPQLDVAFVEGAVASKDHESKLKDIRARSKLLVAIGSCAVTGLPSAQRNLFNEQTRQEIQPILDRFPYLPKAKRLDEVVKVDMKVPGCPVEAEEIVKTFEKLLSSKTNASS